MAMPLESFVGQVMESQLLTAEDVKHLTDGLPEDKRPKDGEQLARCHQCGVFTGNI